MSELITVTLLNKNQVVQNFVEQPKALFVFAHGAGADMNHEFMVEITSLLNREGISVIRFNFPFMMKRAEDGKRRPPDRMPKLIDSFLSVLSTINTTLPLFIGGKSMGGRVAATLMNKAIASEVFNQFKGGICIGYPFHPQKKPEKLLAEFGIDITKSRFWQDGFDYIQDKVKELSSL